MNPAAVGTPVQRTDDVRLLRGDGRYVSDVRLPGMLTAAVVRSPVGHARIRGIDLGRARTHPGVAAAYAADDLGPMQQRPIGTFGEFPPELLEAWNPTIRSAPMHPLAFERVRYVGEPVALVVATDQYVAEDAAALVDLDYEPLEAVVDVEQATAEGAPTLFDGWEGNTALHLQVRIGDVEAAFADAHIVIEERFSIQRHTGVPLEGRAMVVVPDEADPSFLTVWTSHQLPHFQRSEIAEALEVPEEGIRVVQADVGGSFGPKGGLYPEDVLIPFAARALLRPVKWVEDRRENLMASSHSREQVFDAELAVDERGRLLGLRYRVLIDAGAYLTLPVVLPYVGVCHMLAPYRMPALDADIRSVLTNKSTAAPYRGAGRPEATFVVNRLLDRVGQVLGIDPVEVRRRNLIRPEEIPYAPGILYRDAVPMVIDSGDFPAALERCVAAARYDDLRAEQERPRSDGRWLGIGIACNVESTGIGPYETARVRIDGTGRVHVHSGVVDTGQGHRTMLAQVAADVFGVRLDDVEVVTGDTAAVESSRGTYHSRAAVTAGNAVHEAALRVRGRLLEAAAEALEVAPEDLELAGAAVRVAGAPDRSLSLSECIALAVGPVAEPTIDETAQLDIPAVTWGSGTHCAVVAADPRTGGVEILRYVVVHDCGRMINPLIVEGQIHGGVAAGVGGTFFEELVYDESGQFLTSTFMDYLLPTLEDVPPIEVIPMETPSPLNALGVKGVGESGAIASPAALAAAVEDALASYGVRIGSTPVGPRNVLAAIRTASARSLEPSRR